MFGDVWDWAGAVRTRDLNIGVPHSQIGGRLAELVKRLHSWSEFGHSLEIQSVRLHHEAVRIHPFENGNGRWARLLANIWLKRHGMPIVAWPAELGANSTVRVEYLAAVKAADQGDDGPLTELHRRFAERE
jgi:fido (protein-threonine AMPylation protein)